MDVKTVYIDVKAICIYVNPIRLKANWIFMDVKTVYIDIKAIYIYVNPIRPKAN